MIPIRQQSSCEKAGGRAASQNALHGALMLVPASRSQLGLIALLALAGFGFALFSQHVLGMAPCAWCILQRMILLLIAIVAGLGWLTGRERSGSISLAAGVSTLLALGGVVAAWYQHTVAAQSFSCDQTFADVVVTRSGLDQMIPQVFGIYATCADSAVDLFGIRYELWALVLFVLLGFLGIRALAPQRRQAD